MLLEYYKVFIWFNDFYELRYWFSCREWPKKSPIFSLTFWNRILWQTTPYDETSVTTNFHLEPIISFWDVLGQRTQNSFVYINPRHWTLDHAIELEFHGISIESFLLIEAYMKFRYRNRKQHHMFIIID